MAGARGPEVLGPGLDLRWRDVSLDHSQVACRASPETASFGVRQFFLARRPQSLHPPPRPSPTRGEGGGKALPPCGGGLGGGQRSHQRKTAARVSATASFCWQGVPKVTAGRTGWYDGEPV